MKNLGWNKFANVAPNNPTQTRLTRFMRTPIGGVKSTFTTRMEEFQKKMDRGLEPTWDIWEYR